MKRIVCACMVLLGFVLGGCAGGNGAGMGISPVPSVQPSVSSAPASQAEATPGATPAAQGVVLHNTQYGFDFALPESWRGYTILNSQWEGLAVSGSQAGQATEAGPEITIRHPLWTAGDPRQDIPILVFTLAQWDALGQEAFHIGAAPIGPSELNRNSRYVFALPARYNFAYLSGYEEVETILAGKPLTPTEPWEDGATPDPSASL